jgi:ABC-type multidrug transport system fused ATPase/permease subunit
MNDVRDFVGIEGVGGDSSTTSADVAQYFACSVAGTAGAACTILLTTLDDCVWLVPFVSHTTTRRIAILHWLTFSATLIGLTSIVSVVTVLVKQWFLKRSSAVGLGHSAGKWSISGSQLWNVVAATLCWSLAGYFYYRSWLKRKKRQHRESRLNDERPATASEAASAVSNLRSTEVQKSDYGAIDMQYDKSNDRSGDVATATVQPWTVVSLTIVGALDEVSYFPALILGGVFTATELVLGSIFTACTMIFVVRCCLSQCRPLMDLLDQIPLYAVVTCFAIVMSVEAIWEAIE